MENYFKYKGYYGSADVNVKSGILQGEILFMQDIIVYEAQNITELSKEFKAAVDDYLDTCKTLGQEPQIPFDGVVSVDMGEELHREVATKAQLESKSVNVLIKEAITDSLYKSVNQQKYHHEVIAMILILGALVIFVSRGWL